MLALGESPHSNHTVAFSNGGAITFAETVAVVSETVITVAGVRMGAANTSDASAKKSAPAIKPMRIAEIKVLFISYYCITMYKKVKPLSKKKRRGLVTAAS